MGSIFIILLGVVMFSKELKEFLLLPPKDLTANFELSHPDYKTIHKPVLV
jgi:hypothetical protein